MADCRVAQENCAILRELVALRAQKSQLLGFSTHADYVLEMNMAKSSQTVAAFLGSCAGGPGEGGEMGEPWVAPGEGWQPPAVGGRAVEKAGAPAMPVSVRQTS